MAVRTHSEKRIGSRRIRCTYLRARFLLAASTDPGINGLNSAEGSGRSGLTKNGLAADSGQVDEKVGSGNAV